ncbi:hypothetical protein T484DRAFT_1979741 [Baffinella frigidus]|nr:hypothetical protein T484DRAFT_1979741 [Cryptophyta sp. CCMP2293]
MDGMVWGYTGSDCMFKTVPCPNSGCRAKLQRRDLEHHGIYCDFRLGLARKYSSTRKHARKSRSSATPWGVSKRASARRCARTWRRRARRTSSSHTRCSQSRRSWRRHCHRWPLATIPSHPKRRPSHG